MTGKFTFSREERLRYNKHIDRLFSGGKSFVMPPLKVFYLDSGEPEDQPCRVLISVPRRKFKKAVEASFKYQKLNKGTCFIEVVSTCPSNWKLTPQEANKWLENNMFPFYPIGDIKVPKS